MTRADAPLILVLAILAAALVLAWPYAKHIRHPRQRTLAAYLIFLSVFALVGAALFMAIVGLAALAGLTDALGRPVPAMLALLVVLVPAFFAAREVARRPPRQRMPR